MNISNSFVTGKELDSFTQALKNLNHIASPKHVVRMQQVHSNAIVAVTNDLLEPKQELLLKNTDACFTIQKAIALSVKTADCLPVLLRYSPLNLIAAAHAGRKGTQLKITAKLLEEIASTTNLIEMLKQASEPLQIFFGPAICVDCYQIDKETDTHYDLLAENKKQIFDFFTQHEIPKSKMSINTTSDCTLHHNDKYYSYRAHGPGVNMNYSFIWNA